MVDDLPVKSVVYYILDNYAEMPHHYGDYIRDLEARLIDSADLVLATSQLLVDHKSRPGRRAILLPQGVDFAHFHSAAAGGVPEPEEFAQVPEPRILFMGLLAPWVDVDLLAKVAKEYPKASLVLIGPVRADIEVLRKAPNVYFLGPRAYEELPPYLVHCDAALIPFRDDALTRYVNPLKLLEYMAAGLPVISTALPHVTALDGLVYCARSDEEFLAQVGQALAGFSPERRARCVAAARENGWDRRADQFSALLQESLCKSECSAVLDRALTQFSR
jgi:glycosyltransferase involved in cell wall biosynthesis